MISFDNEPVLFFIISNLLLFIAGGVSLYAFINEGFFQKKANITAILMLFSVVLILFRLPIIVYNKGFNPDENMFIVGAMTLSQEFYYWEAVDGGSSGPYIFYIITLFCEFFRQPYDYISTRIIEIILLVSSCITYYLAIAKIFSKPIALFCIFLVIAQIGSFQHQDLIHLSSEHLPILLLGIMAYIYTITSKDLAPSKGLIFIFGMIAGFIIFTKVQVIPIAFAISLAMIWLISKKTNKLISSEVLFLVAGSILFPLMLFLITWQLSFSDKVWTLYFYNHLQYGGNTGIIMMFFDSLIDPINIFLKIIVTCTISLSVYFLGVKKLYTPTPITVFLIAFIGSTLLVVYKTGFVFQHYLLLLIFPAAFILAYTIHEFSNLVHKKTLVIVVAAALIVVLPNTMVYPFTNQYVTYGTQQRPLKVSKTSEEILKYSKPNEKLVIWGDDGTLYLESGRLQGIRWSNSHWGMYSKETEQNYQNTYIKDFEKGKFPIFIDAHSKKTTFMTREKCGYETLPTLKKIIDKKYKFIGEFDEKRVFVRNERFEEITSPQYSSAQ